MNRAISEEFTDRLAEVESYLDLLEVLEGQAKNGPPRIAGSSTPITALQQRILYAGAFLHLYNLVEATMTWCVRAIEIAAAEDGGYAVNRLSKDMRREWVRVKARTHVDQSPDKRLENALQLCDHLVDCLPVGSFEIERGGGGNWDDKEIRAFTQRLGLHGKVSPQTYQEVRKPRRDQFGALELVKELRNRLAHGSISFAQSAEETTVEGLIELKTVTVDYLREIIEMFSTYLEDRQYLIQEITTK